MPQHVLTLHEKGNSQIDMHLQAVAGTALLLRVGRTPVHACMYRMTASPAYASASNTFAMRCALSRCGAGSLLALHSSGDSGTSHASIAGRICNHHTNPWS